MTLKEIEKLYQENIAQIAGMDIASGSVIEGFVRNIERNGNNYVRLSNPTAHRIDYVLVEGDMNGLWDVSRDTGVNLTDTYIEARH